MIGPVTIDYVQDWAARLRTRIYRQFRLTNVEDLATEVIAPQGQQLEDAAQSLLTLWDIDNSNGAQLQLIGRLLGQPPTGEDDATYRLRLKARIRVNLSSGTPDDMYDVFLTMLGLSGTGHAKVWRYAGDIASLTFLVFDPALAPDVEALLFGMLIDASVDGVRLWLVWPTTDPAHAFACDGGPGLGFGDALAFGTGGNMAGAVGVSST